MTLAQLKQAVEVAHAKFEQACRPVYADGVWGAYRAFDRGQPVPENIERAMNEAHAALHAYYQAWNGEDGFLGGRGL